MSKVTCCDICGVITSEKEVIQVGFAEHLYTGAKAHIGIDVCRSCFAREFKAAFEKRIIPVMAVNYYPSLMEDG